MYVLLALLLASNPRTPPASVRTASTGVYTARDLEYWALESLFSGRMDAFETNVSGIWPEREGSKWYARYVLSGSPAEAAGVVTGDELVGLNGRSFDPFGFSAGTASRLTISSDGRHRRTILVTAVHESIRQALLDATERSARILSSGRRKVGYFHLWAGMGPPFLQALNAALSRFEEQRVDALVLDLRGGYGGADLQYLARMRTSLYLERIPKYALIDGGVRSGKEWVAAALRHDMVATLVGSRTAGAFLGGRVNHLFNDKYLLYVAVGQFVPPGIGPLEGVGVAPDVAVQPCLRFCRGSDPQLRAALQLIRARRQPPLAPRPRRVPPRLCDIDSRSCLRLGQLPRLCPLASPAPRRCALAGRLYPVFGQSITHLSPARPMR